MKTDAEFENILGKSESTILDFKKTTYSFANDDGTSKFVKDILCFANTIRTETAYIVFGVGVNEDHTKELVGITDNIDDAILQDKIKDKTFPRPIFKYSVVKYKDQSFGLIEVPVTKYSLPISSTLKLKGLQPGKVYFRRGSANTEANGIETISINDWLRSLPEIKPDALRTEISNLLRRATGNSEKLSTIFTDIFTFAKQNSLQPLMDFTKLELQGFTQADADKVDFSYRRQTVLVSYKSLSATISMNTPTSAQLRAHLQNDEDFFPYQLIFPDSITNLEQALQRFESDGKHLVVVITTTANKLLTKKSKVDYEMYCYAFRDNFTNLYQAIRQKIIDKLMEY